MNTNEENGGDETISRIFNGDPLLRLYLKLAKPQTDALTEEQKKENFVKAILDGGKTNQEK